MTDPQPPTRAPQPVPTGPTFREVTQEPDGCWLACIAALSDVELHQLPAPPVGIPDDERWRWRNEVVHTLHELGWAAVSCGTRRPLEGYCIATGGSPRHPGSSTPLHAVVYRDGAFLFDPHPSRAGIIGEPVEYELMLRIAPMPRPKPKEAP